MKNLLVKSIIVLFTLFLFCSSSFSASDLSYIDDLFAQNNLDEIEKTLNNLQNTSLSLEEQAELLLFYAKLSVEKNQFNEACEYAFKALKFIPEDDAKLMAQANLFKALSYYLKKDLTKTFNLFDLSEKECLKKGLKAELADIYSFKGYILQGLGRDNEAILLFDQALPFYKESNKLKNILDVDLMKAASLNNQAKYSEAHLIANIVLQKNLQLKNPKIDALAYTLLTGILMAQGQEDQALIYADKAINLSKKINDDVILVEANIWKGLILIGKEKFDLAEDIYLKSIEIQSKNFGLDHPTTAGSYMSLAIVYSKMAQYPKALELALKAHNIYKNSFGDDHPQTANSYNQLAELYNKLGNHKKALELYYKSMDNLQSTLGKDHINSAFIYSNIASIFFKQKKYNEALDWYNKALILSNKYYKTDHISNLKLYNNIALCFEGLQEYEKALEYLNKSLNIILNQKDKVPIQALIGYSNLGTLYEKQGKYDEAVDTYLKALNIIKTFKLSNYPATAILYDQLGHAYKLRSKYEKALYYYDEALKIKMNLYEKNHPAIALSYNYIATVFDNMQEYDQALKNYKTALALLKTSSNDEYLALLNANLGYLKQKQNDYKQAIVYYKRAMNFYNSISNYTAIKSDKYNFADTNLILSENIVKSFIAINKPEEALFYSDRSRYQDLLNSLSYKKALLESVIAKNESKKLNEIEEHYQRIQALCLQTSIDNDLIQNQDSIVAKANNTHCQQETFLRKQLGDYTRQLDKKYPQFSKKRFNNLTSTTQLLEIIKNKRLQNTAIIEYYLGENQLYIFVIFNSKVEVITANYTDKDMENHINKYNKPFRLVSLTPTKGLMIDILKKYDLKTSYDLYQILLEKPIEKLQTVEGFDKDTSVIIVPHKSLYYLSFESLITENIAELKKNNNIALSEYQDLPYFIKNFKVSYLPSLSFLEFIDPNKPVDKNIKDNVMVIGNPDLSITRQFTQSIQNLKQLPHSENESNIIHNILGTKSDLLIGDKATEKTVDSKIGDYSTYHFACHGIVDDNNPLYSGLVLSREPYVVSSDINKGYDGILYAYEIINKKFDANLVVLSACDSGLGKLQSGEGMLGLTKSFLVAGANSLVITLWKINDESSSLFMKEFYSQLYLNQNQNTLQALRNAKLTMLETVNEDFQSGKYKGISYSHPYFWAPFVYNGY